MALEVASEIKRKREEVVLNIDFDKAYDCVDWEFLWFILNKMEFGKR